VSLFHRFHCIIIHLKRRFALVDVDGVFPDKAERQQHEVQQQSLYRHVQRRPARDVTYDIITVTSLIVIIIVVVVVVVIVIVVVVHP
jgi:hypothetical protein